jgi:glycosyltransferase involved in cell wall biosynthesis
MESVSVLFVLPSGGGGGGPNSVAQETMGLARLGVDARIGVNAPNHAKLVASYPELQDLKVPFHSYADADELAQHMLSCNLVVATTNASVYDVFEARARLQKEHRNAPIKYAYYVQDYEPLFYPPESERWAKAYKSYTLLTDAMLFAKTQWLCDIVYANHGVRVMKVKPSIDHDVYFPDLRRDNSTLSIVAMMRPSTPRRAPKRTLRIMNAITARFGDVSMQVFGSTTAELASAGIDLPSSIKNWGVLKRSEVPDLLRSADMFLDLSDYQAFGRTALEGMACGCVPIVPILGGVSEYAAHGRNAFVVDTRSDEAVLGAVEIFVSMSSEARAEMRQLALETAADFTVTKAALSELRIFRQLSAHPADAPAPARVQ